MEFTTPTYDVTLWPRIRIDQDIGPRQSSIYPGVRSESDMRMLPAGRPHRPGLEKGNLIDYSAIKQNGAKAWLVLCWVSLCLRASGPHQSILPSDLMFSLVTSR